MLEFEAAKLLGRAEVSRERQGNREMSLKFHVIYS